MPNILFYGFYIEMYIFKYVYGYCTCFFVFSEPRNVPQRGKAADEHATWAKQTHLNVTERLVPDGLKLYKERSASAARRTAVTVGSHGGLVTSYSKTSGGQIEYSVDNKKQECSCGNWALYKYPCACAIAVAMKRGEAPIKFVVDNCHKSYALCPDILQGIADGIKMVLAPTIQQLKTV